MMNKLAASLLAVTTIGCAAETDGALHITGRLAEPQKVTHVIAANPATGDRIVVDMKADGEADGRFNLALPAGGSWIVTFADANKFGTAMKVATLQTGGIDAFTSKEGGSLDFGTVKFSGKYAHGSLAWQDLTAALGFDQQTLVRMSKLDNLALRYANPDVDSNGQIDALEGHDYRLDLAGQYRMTTQGRDVSVSDLISGVGNPELRYLGTSIQSVVPRSMGMNMKSGTAMFDEAFFGTALGLDTPMVAPGTKIGQPHIKFGELGGNPHVGVVAHPEHSAPSGTYRFGFDNGSLTFSDVYAPSVASLSSPTEFAIPFVRIRTAVAGCKTDCEISSIDLEWKRATSFGWETVAQPEDVRIDVVSKFNGREAHLATSLTDGATSVSWSAMPIAGTGITRSELSYISTSEICYLAVSFESDLGMTMTGQVENPACF